MYRRFLPLATLFVLLCLPLRVQAQDLGETLREVGEAYAVPYLQPLANGLGADMNTGLFHTARLGGGILPLVDVYVGVKVMGALVPESDKTLDLTYETEEVFRRHGRTFRVPVTFQVTNAPTVFGETSPGTATAEIRETFAGPDDTPGTADDVVIDTTTSFQLLPGLIDTPIAPLAIPHIRVGSLFGTDVMVRFLPEIGYQDLGSVGFKGIGVRHNLSQYVPLLPLSVAAQVMWQELSIQDQDDQEIFSASSFAASLAASKSFLVLTVYGGLQLERSGVDIGYTFVPEDPEIDPVDIAFELTGANTVRVIGGAAFGLGPINVNLDASVGNHTTVFSAGAGVSL